MVLEEGGLLSVNGRNTTHKAIYQEDKPAVQDLPLTLECMCPVGVFVLGGHVLLMEQGCGGEGQWGHALDFNHRAGSLETSGGLLETVLHRGEWSSAARVWGQGAVTAGGVQQYRAPRDAGCSRKD